MVTTVAYIVLILLFVMRVAQIAQMDIQKQLVQKQQKDNVKRQ